MSRIKRLLLMTFIVFFAAVPIASPQSQQEGDDEGVMVGRISHVEGKLLRYVYEEQDWVATVKDAPFGLDDALYSDEDGKAEFIMPNNTWIRIDGSTQIQLITLKEDVTEVDVASGIVRVYNKSSDGVIKVTTPFGYVMAPARTVADLYVGDQSVEVIALKGSVDFIHEGDEAKYEVVAGASSVVADNRQVSAGEGNVDAEWDDWNEQRDNLWTKRVQVKGESVRYLPENLYDESYTLEENGRWERVRYEGEYRTLWRPVNVSVGWRPYSVGRWSVYYGDNCWVPDEPFGYVTHHYGNWVYVDNGWYWAPPVARVRVHVGPSLGIGFYWNPGRVAWIHSGVDVGWVPLAPHEVYYGHHRWGARTVVVNNVSNININIGNYRYVDHAVVVRQNNFYSVNNYRNVMVTNVNRTTIINNYRPAPVINNTVINNYNTNRQRFNFTNVEVNRKPHDTVVSRIERNRDLSGRERMVRAQDIERDVQRFEKRKLERTAQIESPRVSNRLVEAGDVRKPKDQVKFQERDVKRNAKAVRELPDDRVQGPDIRRGSTGKDIGAGDSGRPGEERSRVRPARPGRESVESGDVGRAPEEGKRVRPARPGRESVETGEEGQRVRPPRPSKDRGVEDGREVAPSEGGRKMRPPKPGREIQQDEQLERGKPTGEERSRVRPDRPSRESVETRDARRVPEEGRVKSVRPGRDRGIESGQEIAPNETRRMKREPREVAPPDEAKQRVNPRQQQFQEQRRPDFQESRQRQVREPRGEEPQQRGEQKKRQQQQDEQAVQERWNR